jgi:hypothetical protein
MALYFSRALFGYEGQTNDLKVVSKGGKAVISSDAVIYKFVLKLRISI